MHNVIIFLLSAITFAPLHGMEKNFIQYMELPLEILTKIVAISDLPDKNALRQTCKRLCNISSIQNLDIYLHTPLVLNKNKAKSILLLMADQKKEEAIKNLLSHNIDFSNEPFEFYLQLSKNYQDIAEMLIQKSTIDINASTPPLNMSHLYSSAQKKRKKLGTIIT